MKRKFLLSLLSVALIGLTEGKAQQSNVSDSLKRKPRNLENLYSKKINENADLEAKAYASFIRKKYSCDSGMEKAIYELTLVKKLELNNYLFKPKKSVDSVSIIISKYEFLEEKILKPAMASTYLNRELAKLDSIKPLTQTQRKGITDHFLKKINKSDEGYKDIFKTALNKATSDTSYYAVIFKDEISRKANDGVQMYIALKPEIGKIKRGISPIIFEQERQLSLADLSFPILNEEKKNFVNTIRVKYKPLIDSVLISNGVSLPNTQFICTAIKYQKALKLSVEQVQRLTSECIKTIRAKEEFLTKTPDGKYDPRPYEREVLPTILTEEQYDQLLSVKFKDQAKKITDEKWAQIQKENLDQNLNVVATKKQLHTFNLNRLIAKERFSNNSELQNAQVKNIDSTKPKVLKKLEAALKNPSNKDEIKNSFTW